MLNCNVCVLSRYLIIRWSKDSAVLVEVGFLSSPREERRMRSPEFQQDTAEALYRAIIAFRDERRARSRRW